MTAAGAVPRHRLDADDVYNSPAECQGLSGCLGGAMGRYRAGGGGCMIVVIIGGVSGQTPPREPN